MPLDGANFVIPAQQVLDAAAAAGELRPPPAAFLERHKEEQLNQHRAGWVYRHRRPIEVALALVMLAGVIGFFVLFSTHLPVAGCAAGVVGLAAATAPMLARVQGPARWRERADPDLVDVHPTVREQAHRLQQHLPEVGFTVGELFRERVTLDPYLVAEFEGARIVLGIWEGDRVIACA